jgi:hypothetical protein
MRSPILEGKIGYQVEARVSDIILGKRILLRLHVDTQIFRERANPCPLVAGIIVPCSPTSEKLDPQARQHSKQGLAANYFELLEK